MVDPNTPPGIVRRMPDSRLTFSRGQLQVDVTKRGVENMGGEGEKSNRRQR